MTPELLIEQFDVIAEAPNGVQRLRELILQLAVRGKLVPQDPEDEPAPRLLERIASEKQRLYREGRISKPQPVAPVGSSDAPFAIPTTWCWVRLGMVAQQRLGKMLDKSKNKGALYPYLRNTNVQWLRFDLTDIKEMRFQPDELDEYDVSNGDLLVCEGGEPGRGAVWSGNSGRMKFQKALHRVRPYCGVRPWYILYCLQASAQSGSLEQYFTGATIKHLTGQSLERFAFPLAPADEQQRIVTKIHHLWALCDRLFTRQRRRGEAAASVAASLLNRVSRL